MKLRSRIATVGVMALGATLALSGCSGSGGGGNASGGTVTITGTFTGGQATALQNDLNTWAKGKGITVKYTGNPNFSTTIVTQVKGGQAPSIGLFPQPGVLKGLISNGVVPLDDLMDVKEVTSDETAGIPDVAKFNGKTYGLPYNISVKSLVWYNPAAFKKAGYSVPTTDDELTALQAKIIKDGTGYPWCVGLASQGSNGWPMTDWFEDYALRYGGLSGYNDWISHKIKFDSPLIKQTAEKVQSRIFADGAVNGGGAAMASTDFGTAGNNLFTDKGKSGGQCFMMKQGSFITGFFPKDIQAQIAKNDTTNVSAFVLPTPSDAKTSGAIGGGDIAAAFKNDSATKQVISYLVGKDFGKNGYNKAWPAALSAHNSYPSSGYYSPFAKVSQDALKSAKAFGFDASDQMPGAVGGGGAAEEANMMEWTIGKLTTDQMLTNIDKAWPGQ